MQEAQAKWPALRARHPDVRLHLIGRLQSNKAEEAVALFDAIHSVDRPSLVDALGQGDGEDRPAPRLLRPGQYRRRAAKGRLRGRRPAGAARASAEAGLPVAGLMCIPPEGVEAAPYFALLAKLARRHGLAGLSMGMSADYESAVMIGATHVRVGTALFGTQRGTEDEMTATGGSRSARWKLWHFIAGSAAMERGFALLERLELPDIAVADSGDDSWAS